MITRYLKTILVNTNDVQDFINAIASTFVDLGFTEVTPIQTATVGVAKSVQFGNFKIDIWMSSTPNQTISLKCYLYYDETNYYTFSTIPSVSYTSSSEGDRLCNLCFFASDDERFIAFNVASYTTQMGKSSNHVFYIITDNEEIARVGSTSNNLSCYSTNQYACTLSLKRTYQKEENVFFKDEGVPILKSSDSSYIMDLPYLITLSGAEAKNTYTMTNGDNYYCLIDNIAVKFDTTAGG